MVSHWIDTGRVLTRPPTGTNPIFHFWGTDGAGRVLTDPEGFLLNPASLPFQIDYLGQLDPRTGGYFRGEEPVENFVPRNASVTIEFQGADAIAEGSREVDPASLSGWDPDPAAVANGRQLIRWRITFDVTADGSELDARTRRPAVQRLELPFEF